MVAFIHRPEYYGLTTNEQGLSTEGMAEIIIAKHRNGEVTDVPLRFVKEQAKFMDADSSITADVLNGGGYSESYDYAASSANSLPPMGSAPESMGGFGGMSGVPSDFDLGPAPAPA